MNIFAKIFKKSAQKHNDIYTKEKLRIFLKQYEDDNESSNTNQFLDKMFEAINMVKIALYTGLEHRFKFLKKENYKRLSASVINAIFGDFSPEHKDLKEQTNHELKKLSLGEESREIITQTYHVKVLLTQGDEQKKLILNIGKLKKYGIWLSRIEIPNAKEFEENSKLFFHVTNSMAKTIENKD